MDNLDVLCLAASGGQQSAAFGILGARVTVFDLSEIQLSKDRLAARHYGFPIETIQGDMQDLSVLRPEAFDLVWLAHAINFVPDARGVLRQVARVCRGGAKVRITFTNPYVHGAWDSPVGKGFLLSQPYHDGERVDTGDPFWTFKDLEGKTQSVEGPAEFRHGVSTIMNALIADGFRILGFWEELGHDPDPRIGSWEHFMTVAPPWLTIWAEKAH